MMRFHALCGSNPAKARGNESGVPFLRHISIQLYLLCVNASIEAAMVLAYTKRLPRLKTKRGAYCVATERPKGARRRASLLRRLSGLLLVISSACGCGVNCRIKEFSVLLTAFSCRYRASVQPSFGGFCFLQVCLRGILTDKEKNAILILDCCVVLPNNQRN